MNQQVILELKNVCTYFPIRRGVFKGIHNYVRAVDNVSLDIYRGQTLGLVGESGCGKTTLGKSILQLLEAKTSGQMLYHFDEGKKDLATLTKQEMKEARKKLQIVFQDPQSSLNPALPIEGSLQEPLAALAGIRSRTERRQIIGDLLEQVNLRREHIKRFPHEFSGGQQQRIGIARALSVNPELIVCDEAVSALDVSIQAQILQLLKDLKDKKGLTYIFISHDLSVIEYISDRIAVMYLGRIVELAPAAELCANPLHPYTQALLSAIPVIDLDQEKRRIILQGDVPNPASPPSGCPFHTRCPQQRPDCKETRPELRVKNQKSEPHFVACHYA